MKTSILILGLFCALISSQAAEAPPPQLVGVAEFGGKQLALIEVPPKQSWQTADLLALMPGQKDGEIELLKVDPSAGSAAISLGGKEVALRFSKQTANTKTIRISDSSNGNDENRVLIQMQEATTSAVLKMHELFSGRTILRGKIHEFGANVISESKVSVSKVLEGLEQALQEQGLAVRQEGSKITMAGTKAMMANVTPDLWQIATQLTPTGTPTGNSQDDALPAGVVSFKNTDMDQVLAILSELVDRTLLQPRTLDSTFYLRTVTPFSKLEATYLFLATLALHQTSVLPVGGKFVLIVPSREADYFKRLLKQKMPSQELLQENSTPTQEMSLETSR